MKPAHQQGNINRNMNHFDFPFHQNELKVISQILNNILADPQNQTYKNLHFHRVYNRLQQCAICMNVLYDAGFHISNNGKRLVYDMKRLNDIKKNKEITTINFHDKETMELNLFVIIIQYPYYCTQK
eukprot:277840_1